MGALSMAYMGETMSRVPLGPPIDPPSSPQWWPPWRAKKCAAALAEVQSAHAVGMEAYNAYKLACTNYTEALRLMLVAATKYHDACTGKPAPVPGDPA